MSEFALSLGYCRKIKKHEGGGEKKRWVGPPPLVCTT